MIFVPGAASTSVRGGVTRQLMQRPTGHVVCAYEWATREREAGGWVVGREGTIELTRRFNRRSAKARSAVRAQRLLQSQRGVPLQTQPVRMDGSQLLSLLLLLSGRLPKVSHLYMFVPQQKQGSGFDCGLTVPTNMQRAEALLVCACASASVCTVTSPGCDSAFHLLVCSLFGLWLCRFLLSL